MATAVSTASISARKLVSKGANVNARMTKEPRDGNRNQLNRIGSTPFLMAAKSDDVPLMRVLLECGADPALTTNRGTTALMAAAGVGIWAPGENPGTHEEALAAVKLALEVGGGKVNDIDQDGETALHGAVYRGGAIPVIQFLIDKGAALDVKNKKGWTPVIVADGVDTRRRCSSAIPRPRRCCARRCAIAGCRCRRRITVPRGKAQGAQRQRTRRRPSENDLGRCLHRRASRARVEGLRRSPARPATRPICSATAEPLRSPAPTSSRASMDRAWTIWSKTIRASMPQDAPDSLGTPAYVDLVGYILKANGGTAGAAELSQDSGQLKQIRITNPK